MTQSYAPIVVSLPIADRPRSHRFYRDGLGLAAIGEPADDGVPEPLQFVINDGLRLMLVPAGGFGWVIGDHDAAPRGQSECVLSIDAGTTAGVDQLIKRVREAGAEVVSEPAQQPWGYIGVFADPDGHLWMVTSGATG